MYVCIYCNTFTKSMDQPGKVANPWSHVTLGAFSLEHKERYDIIIGEEWYMLGLQQVPRTFYGAIYSEHVCISHY